MHLNAFEASKLGDKECPFIYLSAPRPCKSLAKVQEKPAHCLLYSSGLAAAFAVFSHFLPKRVFITGGYHGTHQVLAQLQKISDNARYKKEPLRKAKESGA